MGWLRSYRPVATLAFGLCCMLTTAVNALMVEEITSAKGIKAWLVEDHSVPVVAVKFALLGGALQDPMRKEGLSHLLADLLTEGAGEIPAKAFKERYLGLGTQLSATSSRDAIYISLQSLRQQFSPSVDLLHLMIAAPRFDPDAMERARSQQIAELTDEAQTPAKLALNRWYTETFSGHVYPRPVRGTPDSVANLTSGDLKSQHARLFAQDVLRIVIVGDIDKKAVGETIDRIFGNLPEKAQIAPVSKVEPRSIPSPVVVDMDQQIASAVFGVPSLSVDDPDYPALQVLNHIVGGGDFDSRLMEEVRIKRGLAYAVKTRLVSDSLANLVLGDVSTKNENMGMALDAIRDVFSTIARDGPEKAQFENAKRYLTGSFLLDFDSSAKMAHALLTLWLRGKTPDYLVTRNKMISAVTLDDAKRVAGHLFKPERFIITVVGKPKL